MTEHRRPPRRGRGHRPHQRQSNPASPVPDGDTEASPYLDESQTAGGPVAETDRPGPGGADGANGLDGSHEGGVGGGGGGGGSNLGESQTAGPDLNGAGSAGAFPTVQGSTPLPIPSRHEGRFPGHRGGGGGVGHRPERGSGQHSAVVTVVVAEGPFVGWFDAARDGGFVRSAEASYLPVPGDPFISPQVMRQLGLRRGDLIEGTVGRDHRGRPVVSDIARVNGGDPALALRRPDFSSLVASYPERKLVLETGAPSKVGPELTRRAIDLIAPIGYGQRALIVAPARAGKTMLLQAITEGVAVNHPNATLLVLLVDERPEEVSEMIEWGRGEVVASSFDQPAERHTDVAEMTLERARRLVESGKDVVIVLDSITRLARAHNTVERGTGRTLSGGLDATAMAKPKAFFGSARAVTEANGGGSLTIIATALIETGSRMDDVIFEEFKGTGNCEIKLDRGLAEKRVYPAIDVATSGTRREDKLFRPDQLDFVYTLRRGLQQMPPQAGMEWLIKRIGATPSNDALLSGL
ncbi:MAG: transcription termination factor Rho [Gemmatimonadaceae bacterium]